MSNFAIASLQGLELNKNPHTHATKFYCLQMAVTHTRS